MDDQKDSVSIKNEVEKFNKVHPDINSIYQLLEGISGSEELVNGIRQHVVKIEDSFVNSPEWTMPRKIEEIRVGILGSVSSGKSSLVHRYVTDTFQEDESPEGGRFKKEIIVDNKPFMLLLRDEGDAPNLQFFDWADCVVFISNSEAATNTCFKYFTKLARYRSLNTIPIAVISIADNEEDWVKDLLEIPHQIYFNCDPRTGRNINEFFLQVCKFVLQSRGHQQQQQQELHTL